MIVGESCQIGNIFSKDLDGIGILWSVDQERVLTKDK